LIPSKRYTLYAILPDYTDILAEVKEKILGFSSSLRGLQIELTSRQSKFASWLRTLQNGKVNRLSGKANLFNDKVN